MENLRKEKRHELVHGLIDQAALSVRLVDRNLAQALVGDYKQRRQLEVLAACGEAPQIQAFNVDSRCKL